MRAGVAGTFTIRLGRPTIFHRRSASGHRGFRCRWRGRASIPRHDSRRGPWFFSNTGFKPVRPAGLDVGDRQMLVDLVDAVIGRGLELSLAPPCIHALGDRLPLKDRRVRGHALQAVAFDPWSALAAGEQARLR